MLLHRHRDLRLLKPYGRDYVCVALGTAGTFLGFCAVCVAGFVFVAACVPETKGKSLEEIEPLFR